MLCHVCAQPQSRAFQEGSVRRRLCVAGCQVVPGAFSECHATRSIELACNVFRSVSAERLGMLADQITVASAHLQKKGLWRRFLPSPTTSHSPSCSSPYLSNFERQVTSHPKSHLPSSKLPQLEAASCTSPSLLHLFSCFYGVGRHLRPRVL